MTLGLIGSELAGDVVIADGEGDDLVGFAEVDIGRDFLVLPEQGKDQLDLDALQLLAEETVILRDRGLGEFDTLNQNGFILEDDKCEGFETVNQ